MTTDQKIKELSDKLAAAQEQLRELTARGNERDREAGREQSYRVTSSEDAERTREARERAEANTARTGPRKLGGFDGQARTAAQVRTGFLTPTNFDTVSDDDQPSSGLPSGYGPEEFTICDSGSPVTRNFITDNPD